LTEAQAFGFFGFKRARTARRWARIKTKGATKHVEGSRKPGKGTGNVKLDGKVDKALGKGKSALWSKRDTFSNDFST
jgi:hypothetical protein